MDFGGNSKLLVRHFPKLFSLKDKSDFLRYFGAVDVKCFGNKGRMKNCAFATFQSYDIARQVIKRLHQTNVLDSLLSVEFVREKAFYNEEEACQNNEINNINQESIKPPTNVSMPHVAPHFGLNFPQNTELKYKYPQVNADILINICSALIANSGLYNQVLHLMNKMNLENPFQRATFVPSMMREYLIKLLRLTEDLKSPSVASSESEIECEEDENPNILIPTSIRRLKKVGIKKQNIKRKFTFSQTVTVPTKQRKVAMKKIFKTTKPINKTISINAPKADRFVLETEAKDKEPTTTVDTEQGFGKIDKAEAIAEEETENTEPNYSKMDFITEQQLSANRIDNREMKEMSLFKNYSRGEPTCRLYVKNLAKNVKEKDLAFIFGRYVNFGNQFEMNMFDIRLMTQGRMKGQAFIGFSNVDIAKRALRDCNGYKLMGRPIVVQFARSAKPK